MKSFVLLLVFFAIFGFCQTEDGCPQPGVRKRTIIRSAESIENGAKLLEKYAVDSARQCYKKCCDMKNCNVAVMHYKQKITEIGEELMEKFCFLFDCKSPSVCTYDQHTRYAIIEVPKKASLETTDIIPTTSKITNKVQLKQDEDEESKILFKILFSDFYPYALLSIISESKNAPFCFPGDY